MMMDNELYEAAAGLKKNISIPPHKMNQHYLLQSQTQGLERSENNNILHVAAQHGNSPFISTILPQLTSFDQHSYFALLCQQNSKGETPLHLAAESGDKATVEALLHAHDHGHHGYVDEADKKLCWRERDKNGDTPLHRALRCGQDDIAVLFLDMDLDLVSYENNACESAAYLAAVSFCLVFLQKILDPTFYSVTSVSFSGPRGMTVFHPARKLTDDIMSNLIKAKKELLKHRDKMGKTVLHYAVEENLDLMVKKLLTADSSLGHVYDNDRMTPLHIAASSGSLSSLKTILELSPQSILEVPPDGMTALHVAVTKRDAGFVRICLGYTRMKELINVADNEGNTPLHLALSGRVKARHQLDVADALLEVDGINWRLENKKGLTPEDLCERVNVADNEGNTPLHLALSERVKARHQLDVADAALLEVDGINWRLENKKGLTPEDLCDSAQNTPLKLKSLARDWRRVKERVNMELFSKTSKVDLINKSWDELLTYRGPYGDTILHKVARDGDIEMIKRAKRDSISDPRVSSLLHKENARGETPLHMAAAAGKSDVVQTIVNLPNVVSDAAGKASTRRNCVDGEQFELDIIEVNHGETRGQASKVAPWMVKSENGDTPAHKALRNGHDVVALYLLQLDFSLASCVTDAGESLLYLAAQHDCNLVVRKIMSSKLEGLDDPSSLVFSGPHGRNPLHAAIRNTGGVVPEIKDASFINMLASLVVAISLIKSSLRKGVFALSKSSRFKRSVTNLLITAKPELYMSNKADNCGKTPLHYAVELDQQEAVKHLLMKDNLAAFMYDNQGFTPLLRAMATSNFLCAHLILKSCPESIELLQAVSQKTALHLAKLPLEVAFSKCITFTLKKCMKKHREMSRLINEVDMEGNTPLHCAILDSDQDKALMLLSIQGLNPNIRNHEDKTPLDLCLKGLPNNPKQRSIWLAFESLKVGNRIVPGRPSVISCMKWFLSHHDLLLQGSDEDLKKLLNNISVAATLLVTLTFAATFAIPGGYTQDGRAARMCQKPIKWFVAANTTSTMFGMGVLLRYTVGIIMRSESLGRITVQCLLMLYCAVLATMVAFVSGVYAIVVDDAKWIATFGTVFSVIVFFCVTFL